MTPELRGGFVEVGDPAGRVGCVDRDRQRLEQATEAAFAFAVGLGAVLIELDDVGGARFRVRRNGALEFAFEKSNLWLHTHYTEFNPHLADAPQALFLREPVVFPLVRALTVAGNATAGEWLQENAK
jgi:hypothetical protein